MSEGHERWSEDLAAYVLDALEPPERDALERHLETCEECSAELRWLRPAADLLPETVQRIDPPPQLRERVMTEVRSDAARSAPSRAGSGRRRSFLLRPAIGLAGAAVIVAGIGGYLIGGDDGGGTTTIEASSKGGSVTASLMREGDSGTLELTGLTQLPANQVYQAWVQRDGRIVPSSLFAARADGTASAAIPAQLDGANQVMVTREPRGGSSRPSEEPLISVPVSS